MIYSMDENGVHPVATTRLVRASGILFFMGVLVMIMLTGCYWAPGESEGSLTLSIQGHRPDGSFAPS